MGVLMWPFRAVGVVLTTLLEVMGRLALIVLAFAVLLIGALLLMTGLGSVLGLLVLVSGFALLLRALF